MTPVLAARAVHKSFGQVRALRGADLDVHAGEVVALVGDNGAGKSTLVKVLSGVLAPDAGTVLVDDRPVVLTSPLDARAHGVETVYQDLALAPDLDPSANLFLGREVLRGGVLGWFGVLDEPAMRARAARAYEALGVGLQDAAEPVLSMSGGQRQGVAVARAVLWASRVVLMDEPTAALGVVQSDRVRALIERVRDSGVGVVLISHDLPFVLEVADRIEVLRLGRRVARLTRSTATAQRVLTAMTGLAADPDDDPDDPDGAPAAGTRDDDRSEGTPR